MFTLERATLEIAKASRPWTHQLSVEADALYRDHAREIVAIAMHRRDDHMRLVEERQAQERASKRIYTYVPLRPSVRLANGSLQLRWAHRGAAKQKVRSHVSSGDVEEATKVYRKTIDWKRGGRVENMRQSDWQIHSSEFDKKVTAIDEDLVLDTEVIFGLCRAAWTALTRHRLAHQQLALRFEALVPYQTEAMEARKF